MGTGKSKVGLLVVLAAVVLSVAAAAHANRTPRAAGGKAQARSPARAPDASRTVRIDYDDLVDRSVLTHSGRSVGAILDNGLRGRLPESAAANLQPYLEPFSFACGQIAEAAAPSGARPLASIVDDYPAGSPQPAWAALFREGQYQLFAGEGRARLFLKGAAGETPAALFRRHFGVVRHPLRKALAKAGTGRLALEVFAFRNDYADRSLRLDLAPWVTTVTARDLLSRARPVPLEGLADFFARGPALEAVEIDGDANLFLYGSGATGQTVAGRAVALEDFAVVYRSVFHHGHNPPYVSLDADADNRYARVNFGGLLADTRVGSVLLEADRFFKTIVAGLDPDSRLPVAEAIRKTVPGFRSADERGLFDRAGSDVSARLWFYPDRIRTVTDGEIGVVASHRFTADLERTDGNPVPFRAGRDAVDHLNANYDAYARALPQLRELRTVGRMMAIAKWLQGARARHRVDLDALLSVEVSPFQTPARSRKILAATRASRGSGADGAGTRQEAYCLDEILDGADPATTEKALLEQAKIRVAHLGVGARRPGGGEVPPPRAPWYIIASISGGIEMNPATLAPPQQAPRSPLIAKIRAIRASASKGGPVAAGGIYRSTLRGLPAPSAAPAPPAVPRPRSPAPKPHGAPPAAAPVPRPAAPAASAAPGAEPREERKPRDPSKGFAWKPPSYPAEIVATGEPRAGGTIVLKRGVAR